MELIKRTCSFSLWSIRDVGLKIMKDTVDLNKLGNKNFDFE